MILNRRLSFASVAPIIFLLCPTVQADESAASGPHWSFQPPTRPALPHVNDASWVRNPIDSFVLRRREEEGIAPSPEAVRATLMRRVTLDLIGLLPTPAEVAAFVSDDRPAAYERLVDRLLASPHYGEKWARHWLDLCHYGDTDGYLTDQLRPYAWRYRDWLIAALNNDLSFDQFTVQQLAGDLLPAATTNQRIATGFLRQTLSNREGGADLEEFRVLQVVDRTALVGTIWLGLTVGCARCHDHFYDPISQREFYELYAFFDNADEVNIDAPLPGQAEAYREQLSEYQRQRRALIAPVADGLNELQRRWELRLLQAHRNPGADAHWDRQWELLGLVWGGGQGEGQLEGIEIVKLQPSLRSQRQQDDLRDYFLGNPGDLDPHRYEELKLGALRDQLNQLKSALPPISRAPTMRAAQNPRQTYIHLRGHFRDRGEIVQCRVPSCITPPESHRSAASFHQPQAGHQPIRLALAHWLVSPNNPLTARVTVNRMWQEFFGRGIVLTSEDFGTQGQPPSHPELLDWLATEFMERGWSTKAMHRLIVTSSTYRQSSRPRPELAERDPRNDLLSRQNSLRVSAEAVRDLALIASGLLSRKLGGPGVKPPQPARVAMEAFDNKQWQASSGEDRYRRAVYTFIIRTAPFAQGAIFDAPNPSEICTRRERSNTPLQALTLLNDEVFFEAAQALAGRILSETSVRSGTRATATVAERIEYAFRLCLSRAPSAAEKQRLGDYFQRQRESLENDPPVVKAMLTGGHLDQWDPVEAAAWTGVGSVLLNLHEFITRE